jgi:hypothetical protein
MVSGDALRICHSSNLGASLSRWCLEKHTGDSALNNNRGYYMILNGTIVNVAAISAGALVGRYAGRFIPERIRLTVMAGLGLTVILIFLPGNFVYS